MRRLLASLVPRGFLVDYQPAEEWLDELLFFAEPNQIPEIQIKPCPDSGRLQAAFFQINHNVIVTHARGKSAQRVPSDGGRVHPFDGPTTLFKDMLVHQSKGHVTQTSLEDGRTPQLALFCTQTRTGTWVTVNAYIHSPQDVCLAVSYPQPH